MQNALARGESIEKASKSLLNAGYSKEDIILASKQMKFPQKNQTQESIPERLNQSENNPQQGQLDEKNAASPQGFKEVGQPKKVSKGFLVLLIIITVLILVGAAIAGIFWDKIF